MPHLRSRSPSPEPTLTPLHPTNSTTQPSPPRQLVVLFLGIKPFRKLWTGSQRPEESVLRYILFNGSPAVVLPAKPGSPLIAWHGMTLEHLRELEVPKEGVEVREDDGEETFGGVLGALCEYVELCVDWERVVVGEAEEGGKATPPTILSLEEKKVAMKNALTALLVSVVKCKGNKEVDEEVDEDRAGIVVFRIP